jgi:DNA-binding GntR family transcriptional regulator
MLLPIFDHSTAQADPTGGPETRVLRPNLHGAVVGSLREMIVSGVLRPGARLAEHDLCRILGLSRTPLREAVKVLASEQLIHIVPNRGAYVAPILEAEVRELFDVMAALDGLVGLSAARCATQSEIGTITDLHHEMASRHAALDRIAYFRINQKIHEAMLVATHNTALVTTYLPILHKVRRARYLANDAFDRRTVSLSEHQRILDALVRRDGEKLARLLPEHTLATGRAVLRALTSRLASAMPAGHTPAGDHVLSSDSDT